MIREPIVIHAQGSGIVVLWVMRDIKAHFQARRSEWATACMVIGWGSIVSMTFPIVQRSPAWGVLARLASEELWGFAAVTVGVMRLIALILNGTFWRTWCGRWSPHIRAAGCGAPSIVWLAITLVLWASLFITTGLPIYAGLFALDAINAWGASREAGAMDGARARATDSR